MHRNNGSLCDYNRAGTADGNCDRARCEVRKTPWNLPRTAPDHHRCRFYRSRYVQRHDAFRCQYFHATQRRYQTLPRVEIKNLNSFKSLERALTYQQNQLIKQWEAGTPPTGETTVGWLDDEEKTVLLRDKESAADYRYFPEPDIPPLALDPKVDRRDCGCHAKVPSK